MTAAGNAVDGVVSRHLEKGGQSLDVGEVRIGEDETPEIEHFVDVSIEAVGREEDGLCEFCGVVNIFGEVGGDG